MKKYFCDVCGAETASGDNAPSSWVAELCGLEDLCPRCESNARELNVAGLVLEALRRMAERTKEPPLPEPEPIPIIAGRNAQEKRKILAAIAAYRKEHGLGSIATLAKLAGVEESQLRDMIQCLPVPIALWRKVGRALEVPAP